MRKTYLHRENIGELKKCHWRIIARSVRTPSNISKYVKFKNRTHYDIDSIPKLESQNKIKINLYKIYKEENSDRHSLALIRRGNNKYYRNACNIIIFQYKNKFNVWHCVLVKGNMERFIVNFSNIRFADKNNRICTFCFSPINAEHLRDHKNNYCINRSINCKLIYPKGEDVLVFKNFGRSYKIPIIGFFDIECALIPNEKGEKIHKPIIYSQIILDTENNKILDFNTYKGENPIDHYLDRITLFWSKHLDRVKSEKYKIHCTKEHLLKF